MLSGDDVERWILKTLCTHIVAVRKFGDNWGHPKPWLDILWDMKPFPSGCGLEFNQGVGESSPDAPRLGASCNDVPRHCWTDGSHYSTWAPSVGFGYDRAELPTDARFVLQTEYYRPTDFVINFGKSEVVYSVGWADSVTLRQIHMSWAPNA